MSEEYLREMRELEKQEIEQRKSHTREKQLDRDRYNTLDPTYNYTDYQRIIGTSLEYAPVKDQTWLDYYQEIKIHAKNSAKLNRNCHIFGKSTWHTHSDPRGCWMCADNIMISMLVKIIGLMANQYPKNIF